MYFPNAFKKTFLPASMTLASGVETSALTAGQVGFYAPTSASNSSLATLAASVKPFYFVQGSYFAADKIGSHGGYKESIKSKLINPKYISRVIKIAGKSPVQHVVKVSASAGIAADSTVRLRIDIKGSPALRFLNHQLYRTLDSYSGCANATNPTYVKDPVVSLLAWKDQINSYPIFPDMVKARVYKHVISTAATAIGVAATTSAVTITVTNTSMAAGMKVVGVGIPANAFITSLVSTTGIVVTYPVQAVAPTIASNVTVKAFTDVYSEAQAAAVTFIPGTSVVTGGTPVAYSAAADAASFSYTENPHLELTAGFVETSFGNCTFTPTDKYELEPLAIYASVVDESGNACAVSSFVANANAISASNPYLSSHGIEVQAFVQASGSGESVLRDFILSGRYAQNAYPDSGRVDSLRMREIEADPALAQITRSSLYDQLMVLHNVPRWNNPSSTFDNDQYLLVIYVPKGTASTTNITDYFVTAANAAQGASTIALESY